MTYENTSAWNDPLGVQTIELQDRHQNIEERYQLHGELNHFF